VGIEIEVAYADHTMCYFSAEDGWKVDSPSRCLVIGRGVPRMYIPLDSVHCFRVTQRPEPDTVDDVLTDAFGVKPSTARDAP
jgi:hypothetical protein